MFAIAQIKGHQYRINPGEQVVVDRLTGDVGDQVIMDKVLLVADGDKTLVGKPYVEDAVVNAKITEHLRGEKMRVARFRAKSNHRRVVGHKSRYTKLEITGIEVAKQQTKATKTSSTAAKKKTTKSN